MSGLTRATPGREATLPRLAGLDGLRAIAVMLVIGLHTWRDGVRGGAIGVNLFFVLSGFLITLLLVRERTRVGRISLTRFYMRRALRLMPALAVVLVVAALFSVTIAAPDVGVRTRAGIVASLVYVANWGRALDVQQTYGALGHTWSLSIEEQFYLAWPLLLIALLRWGSLRTAFLTTLSCILVIWLWRANVQAGGASQARVSFGFDTRADSLLAGCAVALAHAAGWLDRIPRRAFTIGAALGIEYLAIFAIAAAMPIPWSWSDYPVQTIALAVLIASVTQAPPQWLIKGLELRPLVALGTISYGCYLWHYVVWTALSQSLGSGPVALAVVGTSTLALATLSYLLLERPALRLKSRLGQRSGPRLAGPGQPGRAPAATGAAAPGETPARPSQAGVALRLAAEQPSGPG